MQEFTTRAIVYITIIMLTIVGCGKKNHSANWKITYPTRGSDSVKFVPDSSHIQTIYLSNRNEKQIVYMIAPVILSAGNTMPDSLFSILATNAKRQKTNNADSLTHYYYAFKIKNNSPDTAWGFWIEGHLISSKIFIKQNHTTLFKEPDSLETTTSENFTKTYFSFNIAVKSEITLMVNLNYVQAPQINEFSFMPVYPGYKLYREDKNAASGYFYGVSLFIVLTLLYFLIVTQDYIYLFFIAQFIFTAIQVGIMLKLFSIELKNTPSGIFMVKDICMFIVLILLPYKIPKRSKILYLLTGWFILSVLIDYVYVFFPFRFNEWIGYSANLVLMGFFIAYNFQKKQNGNIYHFSRTIAVVILVLNSLLWTLVLTNNLPARKGMLFYLFLSTVLFIICLAVRFVITTQTREVQKINRAVADQKHLSETIIATLENERKRISQDIHDELGGNLAVLKIKILSLTENREQLDLVMKIIDKASDSVRTISHRLMPPYFNDTDFRILIQEHFNDLNEKGLMQFSYYCSGEEFQLTKEEELILYRILMELVHNCLKHSRAKRVTVQLNYLHENLAILCEDDGQGFPSALHAGVGLQSINTRVLYLKGEINIDSTPRGTTIVINIPFAGRKKQVEFIADVL